MNTQAIRGIARAVKKAVLGSADLNVIGRSFRVAYEARGAWEEHDYALIAKSARGLNCVYDVGANKGITSIIMASVMADGGQVYAFEPSSAACEIIRDNAKLNGLEERVRVVDGFVAARSGALVRFFCDGASVLNSSVPGYSSGSRLIEPMLKPTIALDDIATSLGQDPQFLKVDVEGGELDVLKGMRAIFRRTRPTVHLEIHELPGTPLADHTQQIIELLGSVDYQLIWLRSKARLISAAPLAGRHGRTHAMLLHERASLPAFIYCLDTSSW